MQDAKTTVLISGCSEGGMGEALAKEFHSQGFEVYATAREIGKMKGLADLGIKPLSLDIRSGQSIQNCVARLPALDILVNNAAVMHTTAITDMSIREAKEVFDANVWGHLSLIQACMPLLLCSKHAMIVNHTSVGTALALPFQSVYNASKAAFAMFSDTLRLELEPFGIKVVELKTGGVKTNVLKNLRQTESLLPESSIYNRAKELMERSLRREGVDEHGISPELWARQVVADLQRGNPPLHVYRGESAWIGWLIRFVPFGSFNGPIRKMCLLDQITSVIREGHGT